MHYLFLPRLQSLVMVGKSWVVFWVKNRSFNPFLPKKHLNDNYNMIKLFFQSKKWFKNIKSNWVKNSFLGFDMFFRQYWGWKHSPSNFFCIIELIDTKTNPFFFPELMSIDKLFSSRSNLVIFSPFSNSMIEK